MERINFTTSDKKTNCETDAFLGFSIGLLVDDILTCHHSKRSGASNKTVMLFIQLLLLVQGPAIVNATSC